MATGTDVEPPAFHIAEQEMAEILEKEFRVKAAKMKLLNGYYDLNYYVKEAAGDGDNNNNNGREFIFKIYHGDHKTVDELRGEIEMLNFLQKRKFPVPELVPTNGGGYFYTHQNRLLMRLQLFFRGQIMGKADISPQICYKLGDIIGRMDAALIEMTDNAWIPKAEQKAGAEWNLEHLDVLKSMLCLKDTPDRYSLVERAIDFAKSKISPALSSLPSQAIHGDINEQNVIVTDDGSDVVGIIDFGDAVVTKRVFEPAVAMVYWLLFGTDPVQCVKSFYEAYIRSVQLTSVEKSIILPCMIGRFAQSLAVGNHTAQELIQQGKPTDYVLMTSKRGFAVLSQLMDSELGEELAVFFENN